MPFGPEAAEVVPAEEHDELVRVLHNALDPLRRRSRAHGAGVDADLNLPYVIFRYPLRDYVERLLRAMISKE